MKYTDLSPEERARLRNAYEAGFSAGSGRPWLLTDDEETIALADAVADDWLMSLETMQASARVELPPVPAFAIPSWLRALSDVPERLETAPLGRRDR